MNEKNMKKKELWIKKWIKTTKLTQFSSGKSLTYVWLFNCKQKQKQKTA